MPTFKYAKLVRDNIADWHTHVGHTPKVTHLEGKQLIRALCKKLHEEADEVDGALDRKEMIEEIADVQQILDDLCAVENIKKSEIESVRAKKAEQKGGFQKGVYIDTVYMPNEADKWAKYCRKNPTKYPEVDT